MSHARFRALRMGILVLIGFLALSAFAIAQTPVERPTQAPAASQVGQVTVSQDARETREELESLLKRLPPAVGRVLRTDPSLMRNQSYLATYPPLAAFLQQHPEVANNAGYYLENISLTFYNPPTPPSRESAAISMWRNFIEGLTMMVVFLVITAGVLWLFRAVLEHRRWHRTFKMQADLQNKLLDKFTSHEELLAYLQSPGGRQFIDVAPIQPEAPSRPAVTPFNRILWSVQVGIVLAAGSLGLLFVSRRVIEEVAQMLFAAGVLALALGIGFVVSAAASLLLSQRLGLLGAAAPREHSGPTGA